MPDRQSPGSLLYFSGCVIARDVSPSDHESVYEVITWPCDEDREDDCDSLAQALAAIGPWAQFAVPSDVRDQPDSETMTFTITAAARR